MSREVELKLLADADVMRCVQRYVPGYYVSKVVAYADAFGRLAEECNPHAVDLALVCLPAKLVQNATKQVSADAVIGELLKQSTAIVESLDIARDQFVLQKEAEAEAIAAAERQAQEDAARKEVEEIANAKAQEEARAKARQEKDNQQRAAAANEAEEQRRLKEAEENQRRLDAEAAAKKDKENAEGAASGSGGEGPLAASELESMPVEESGIPDGIVNDITRSGLKTIGSLITFGESRDYTDINGVGPVAKEKIIEILAALKSRVEES